MQQTAEPKTKPVKARNYSNHVRLAYFVLLVGSLMYNLFGGEYAGHPVLIIFTTLSAIGICILGVPSSKLSAAKKLEIQQFDKALASWLMMAFMIANAATIIYNSFEPAGTFRNDSGDWIANRFLYLAGLGFFLPALVEAKLRKSKRWRNGAFGVAGVVMFLGFLAAYVDHMEGCTKTVMWYTRSMLVDDCAMSISTGLLVTLFVIAQESKRV